MLAAQRKMTMLDLTAASIDGMGRVVGAPGSGSVWLTLHDYPEFV